MWRQRGSNNWKPPRPVSPVKCECFCSSRLPIFFFLFYLQTLIFLAENRKPYQIGITVPCCSFPLLAPPKDGMDLSFIWKPSAVFAQTYSEPGKENEGGGVGGSPGSRILKQRAVAHNAAPFTDANQEAMCTDWEHRAWGALHCARWPCRTGRPVKKREDGSKSGPLESTPILYGNGHGMCGRPPVSSLPSPLLVTLHSFSFLPCLIQDYHGEMPWGLQRALDLLCAAQEKAHGHCCRRSQAKGLPCPGFIWNASFFAFLESPQQQRNCSMKAQVHNPVSRVLENI